ncbi:MAG: MFS transporter [Nitrososphaeria archaeon]
MWTIYISHMFNEIYLLTHLVLIPVFITEFKLTLFQVSFVATIPTLIGILMNIIVRFSVDKIGARPLLILGFLCQALGGIIMTESWSFESLILGLSFIGIANPLYHNPGLSTISRTLFGQELTRGAGIHAATGSVGSSIGLFTLMLTSLVFLKKTPKNMAPRNR